MDTKNKELLAAAQELLAKLSFRVKNTGAAYRAFTEPELTRLRAAIEAVSLNPWKPTPKDFGYDATALSSPRKV